MGRYIDPRTDFGFKRLFGQEDSKDILAQFLFDVLALPHPITELSFIPAEQLPASPAERRGIYDIYCVDRVGRRFIVEMQQGFHSNLKERALYYSTFAITYQARRGADWQFELLPIYCIVVLDFVVVDEDERYLRRIQLMDTEAKTVWLEHYTQVFIELAKFNRALPEATPADKWIYLLKYMPELQQIPAELANEPFTHAFAIAEEAALSPDERWLYEGSLKQARDFNARLQYALETGFAEGKAEGEAKGKAAGIAEGKAAGKAAGKAESQREIARSMLARGLDSKLISEITGLTATELNQLSKADL